MSITSAALCIALLCAATFALASHPGNVVGLAVAGDALSSWAITWTPVTSRIDGAPITGTLTYRVEMRLPDGSWVAVASVSEASATAFVGAPCAEFRVLAIEDGSTGNPSEVACGRLGKLTSGPRYVVARNSAYLTRPAYATSGGLRSSTPIGRVAIGEPCDAAITIGSYLSVAGRPNAATADPLDVLPAGAVAVCEIAP